MFKKSSAVILSLLSVMCLSSCFSINPLFEKYEDYLSTINTKYEEITDNYYKLKAFEPLQYKDLADTSKTKTITSFRDVYSSQCNGKTYLNMNSIGEEKVLVLPVSFKDGDKSSLDSKYIYIQNGIFGKESKTVHESVASYYNEVSYGHFKLTGEVAPFYDVDLTSEEILAMGSGNATGVSRYITDLAYQNWLKDNQDKASIYDVDHDGYVDAVMTVYDYPYGEDEKTLFWAFVDHMRKNEKFEDKIINDHDIALSSYAWISYDFLNPSYGVVDAHVFIHEFGHILGLQDYYSKGVYQPLGFMDMMDYNLGDHNAFSKMLLNWTTPKVVTGEGSITLRPSYNSGDCILIPSKTWNKTPYDEFLLLEFYAPEGVNYYDTRLSFKYNDVHNNEKKGNLFTNYGIKVYHVDSRIGYMENKLIYGSPICLFDDPDLEEKAKIYQEKSKELYNYVKYCIDFPFNNALSSHPYIKLIEAKELDSLSSHNAATNNTLFQVGDDMGINYFKDFKFYDGSSLPFNFVVDKIDGNSATITFKK